MYIQSVCTCDAEIYAQVRVDAESTAPAHLKHNSSSPKKRGNFTRVHACVAKDVIW